MGTGVATRERTGRAIADRPSGTAEINATQRAAETLQPPDRRLVDDPYARHLVSRRGFRALTRGRRTARLALRLFDRAYPGLHAEIVLRGRFVDEELAAARERGVDQVVLLGAGYDSLAYRHRGGPPFTVFEVDAPTTQEAKRSRALAAGLVAAQRQVFVPCDFDADRPGERLAAHGFAPARPSLVVWLGVTYYLSRQGLEATLGDVAAFAAPGSRLVVDYMDPEVIDGTTAFPGAQRAAAAVARRGEPYVLGLEAEAAEQTLVDAGFVPREHLRTPDLARRYGGPGGAWCRSDDFMGVIAAERVGG